MTSQMMPHDLIARRRVEASEIEALAREKANIARMIETLNATHLEDLVDDAAEKIETEGTNAVLREVRASIGTIDITIQKLSETLASFQEQIEHLQHRVNVRDGIVPPGEPSPFSIQRENALTVRELDILKQICTGRGNKEIAAILFLSEKTVKNHTSRLFSKMRVDSRAAAVSLAYRTGWVGLDDVEVIRNFPVSRHQPKETPN